ncbi:hypothetical protein MKW92_034738 [Papaver armeniacum]|nr:hypothetical protein MKW92_034738 [Papaver armeniacum]
MRSPSSSLVSAITKRLEGKVAIVTSGASGIGECTAKLFARYGAKVVIADVQDDPANLFVKDANDFYLYCVSYVHCDVSKEHDVKNLIDVTMEKYGKLDIMFNNTGMEGDMDQSILDGKYENYRRVYDVNAIGSVLGAKHLCRGYDSGPRKEAYYSLPVLLGSGGLTPTLCYVKTCNCGINKEFVCGIRTIWNQG